MWHRRPHATMPAIGIIGIIGILAAIMPPSAFGFHVPTTRSTSMPARPLIFPTRAASISTPCRSRSRSPSFVGKTVDDETNIVRRSSTRLFSLSNLINDINQSASNPSPGKPPRTVFVGGKGGVGKTTISSTLAVTLASDFESDLNILVVSTDPAHSLGDALDVDLRSSGGEPVVLTDPLTGGRLHACEVNPAAALDSFRANLQAFDVNRLADALGVSPSLLEGLGLKEFSGLLNNPPPGLDELVALSNVLDVRGVNEGKFDAIVVDTAPTGHTLRMLQLPTFIDGFLGKLIELRMKLSGLASTLQAMFGSTEAQQRAQAIDDAVSKLEEFKLQMSSLKYRLTDAESTSFVVVTIPTKLGVAESKRLMGELKSQGVAVTDIVVNQCVGSLQMQGDNNDDSDDGGSSALASYYERRKSGQQRWISEIRKATEEVSSSSEYKGNGSPDPIAVTEVPFFDVELVGVPALAYVGKQTFESNPSFSHLLGDDGESKFVICGGKGGVGKTTTSSSLAITMAAAGHNVAIVSTDPAHSLGDALDIDLKGGMLVDLPLTGEGTLSALEIDPAASLRQFKKVQRWISEIRKATEEVSSSSEYKGNGSPDPIAVTEVPFFDVELVGVPALAYVGKQTFESNPSFSHLLGDDGESKFVICGGKGGVGKTTTSSSLAITMAAAGHNVAIVSTDPAHSLGDALDIDLKGGMLVDLPLTGEGTLSALEIDPAASLRQFKKVVDDLIGGDSGPKGDLANTLSDLGDIFDTLPAGTDEVVALAKVVGLIKKGNFDRIVLDTAPTGHTLRMLSTPSFLADLIERVLAIANKINSNAAVKMLITSAAGGEDIDAAAEAAKSTLLSFQLQMWDLEDLFADAEQTEFLIVTVPTELAVRESIRLMNDLTFEAPDMPIKVRNVVANQVLSGDADGDGGFLRRAGEGEAFSLADLRTFVDASNASPVPIITQVPYLDTEPRGVYGLKALSEELVRE